MLAFLTPTPNPLSTPVSVSVAVKLLTTEEIARLAFWLMVIVFLWCVAIYFRPRIKGWLRSNGAWKFVVAKTGAYAAAVSTTIVLGWFEPWKPTSWAAPASAVEGIIWAALFGSIGLWFDWAREAISLTHREQLEAAQEDLRVTQQQLDDWVRATVQTGSILDHKLKTARELSREKQIAFPRFIEALDPQEELFRHLYVIHEHITVGLKPGSKLRLALYTAENDRLVPRFSWNGHARNCVKDNPDELQISSSEGVKSKAVECYHLQGDHRFIAVANCDADPTFKHFRVGQSDYLKSLFAFKHRLEIDGTQTAMILCLDCDEAEFFNDERAESIRTFFIDMMKRVEYEALTADVIRKLDAQI